MIPSTSRRALGFALAIGLTHFLVVETVQPLLSRYATHLGAGPAMVGLVMSSYGLIPMLLAIPIGRLSDRADSRRVVRAGAIASLFAVAFLAAAPTHWWVIAAQAVFGCGHVAVLVSTQTYVALVSTPESRDASFGYYGAGTAVGQIIAPVVAGTVVAAATGYFGSELTGIRIALLLGALAAFAPLAAGLLMPSAGTRGPRPAHGSLMWTVLRRRGMQVSSLATFVQITSLCGRITFHPLYLSQEAGYGPAVIGLLFTVHSAASLMVRPFLGHIVRLLGRQTVFLACMVVVVVSWIAIPLSFSTSYQFANMIAAGIATGLLTPLNLVMVAAYCPGESGLGMGVRLAVNRLAVTAAPAAIGAIAAATGLGSSFAATGIPLLFVVLLTGLLARGLWEDRSPAAGRRATVVSHTS